MGTTGFWEAVVERRDGEKKKEKRVGEAEGKHGSDRALF